MSDERDCLRRRIIANIRETLKEKKIKQDTFQIDAGINIGRILCKDIDIRVSTLEKIAKHLGVSVEELIK